MKYSLTDATNPAPINLAPAQTVTAYTAPPVKAFFMKLPLRAGLILLALASTGVTYAADSAAAPAADEPPVAASAKVEEKFPLAPNPVCIYWEKRRGHDDDTAKKICRDWKKRQSRIYVKKAEELVEMTVGSPPMISDDTGTPGPYGWEINVIGSGDISADSKSYEFPVLDLNYGLGDRTQLTWEIPYAFNRVTEVDDMGNSTTVSSQGVANSSVAVKYRFYDNEDTGLSMAFYPHFEFRLPGSRLEEDGGVATRATAFILPLLLTREFDYVSLTANLGAGKSSDDSKPNYFSSVGLGTRLSPHVAILGELAGMDLGRGNERRVLLNIGLRGKLSEKHALAASVGRDLIASGDGQKHFYFTLAYQLFIEHDKKEK